MSGLYLHTSNRLETLAAALGEVVARPLASPLAPETVAVQSKGMERWLSLQLAARRGIWANYRFPFPNALIRALLASVLDNTGENPQLQPELLAWRLYALLPGLLDRPAFAPLVPYLAAAPDDPLRRWQLCWQLADCFDQYLVYRHDLIRTWERGGLCGLGPHEGWQAELWRLLAPRESAPHRARLVEAFAARIAQGPLLAGCRLPERLSLFGVTTLPPLHLEVLAAVAPFTEVHLFLLNPCRGYWFELKTPQEEVATLRRAARQGLAAEELWLAGGHPLLASLGKSGRDLFRRLFDCELTSREHFVPAAGATLLSRVQNEILDGETWPPAARQPLAAGDRSLAFHSCYGPMREVEALHDLLLAAFRECDGLAPREVLVMAPDIEVYAPLIEAVFGAEFEGKRLIPYAISDRGPAAASTPHQALARLCRLPEGRRGAADLLDLLELAPVMRRFGVNDDDLAVVRDWVESLHIHWGLDDADRAGSGAPAEERFTWRAGLDRLLLGLALPEDELFAGLLPAGGAAASPALLGTLCDFVAAVGTWCEDCRRERPVAAWAERLRRLLDDLLDPGTEPQQFLALHRACATLAGEAQQAGVEESVPFAVVRSRLETLLGERSSHGFLSGPVTFCTLQPMRSVPFRVIALIGMNDGDFPRQGRSPGFDLMGRERRLCDPQRRDEDRYLFLEALLSARERLIVTWQGNDPRDAGSRPPAVVVGELLDALCAGADTDAAEALRKALVVRHPLQPFSPACFRAGSPVAGANPHWFAAAQAGRWRLTAESPFCLEALPLAEDFPATIPLGELERFWKQPAEYFLKKRLRLRLLEPDEGVVEREPFALDGLDNYRLGQDLTAALLAGATAETRLAFVRAGGALPAGPMGEGAWRTLAGEAHAFAATLQPFLAAGGERTVFTLELNGRTVCGELAPPGSQGRVVWRFAKLRAKDRLMAWLRHLCACAANSAGATVLVGRDERVRYAPLTAQEAADHLAALLEHYLAGCCRPLPFFPESSLAYADVLCKGKGRDEALALAHKLWASSEFHAGEDRDRHFCLCFGPEPLDCAFEELSQAIWSPLLLATEVVA